MLMIGSLCPISVMDPDNCGDSDLGKEVAENLELAAPSNVCVINLSRVLKLVFDFP